MAQHHNLLVFFPVRRLLVVLLVMFVLGVGAACSGGASTERVAATKIDALFAEWNTQDSAGCGVGVNRNGTMVFERGYGMANLEQKVPITTATLFDPASIAKPFTALSVMLLAEQGKLSLEDEVWKHVPEWVDRADRVTIRHLLAHTAGLRDAFLLIELAPPPATGVDINAHSLRTLAAQRGVNFAPSTEFSYNNGGYNVLGSIVARISGQSFREFVAAHIFGPLGMTHSSFRGVPIAISAHHALGYHRDERGFHLARDGGIDTSAIVGNSGLFTTVGDLLRFAQNFGDARVGSRESLSAMQTAASLGEHGTSPWGLGLEVGVDGGLKTVGHGGGDRGIAAYVIRYPAHDLNVAVLCNLDNLNARVGTLARQVAALYLPPVRSPRSVMWLRWRLDPALTASELATNAGLYRDLATGTYGRVYVRDGKLWASEDAGDGPAEQRRVATSCHEPVLDFWRARHGGLRGTNGRTSASDPRHGRGTKAVRVGAGGRRFCADARATAGVRRALRQPRSQRHLYGPRARLRARDPDPRPRRDRPAASVPRRVLRIAGRSDQVLPCCGTAGDRLHHQSDQRPQSALRAGPVGLAESRRNSHSGVS